MSIKVVIAEDEFAVAENLKALMASRGYRVFSAADGVEAVELCRKERPEVLLLDILMPRMGGFDVCRILKSDPATKSIKILMITALDRMGDIETAFQHGASDYLTKPFDQDKLFKKLDKVLAS
ncbi:MAG: response regulator [Elusimicrobiota bacterium]|jgi:two-component system cell cycle response regulator